MSAQCSCRNQKPGPKIVNYFVYTHVCSEKRLLSDYSSTAVCVAAIPLSHTFGYYGAEGQVTRDAIRQLEHFPLQ